MPTDTAMPTDEERFFRDLGATAEEAVEQVRGIERNYFGLLQNAAFGVPWIADLSRKLQGYADRNIAAALDFSHQLSGATGFPTWPEFKLNTRKSSSKHSANRPRISRNHTSGNSIPIDCRTENA